jgi:hypothetical protein
VTKQLAILNLALDGGDWSPSCVGRRYSMGRAPGSLCVRGWAGVTAGEGLLVPSV